MTKAALFGKVLILLIGFFANAQTLVWTGVSDKDFFNEANWKDSITNAVPTANTINPATNINLTLQINSAAAVITATGEAIQLGTGSLTIGSANLTATSLSGGNVTINSEGYIELSDATPFLNSVQINFTTGIGWIKTTNYNASAVSASNLGQIKVNNDAAVYQTNLRLDHYYLNGCVIRSNLAATTPLTVYDNTNLGGTSAAITVNTIHSNTAIANSMNNKIESFILKKGFMVTFANEIDGTGKSKNYIASEQDLVINELPRSLQNAISFIRVTPWNWVTKKGRTDPTTDLNSSLNTDLNTTWLYKWNNILTSTLYMEYAPMAWGWGSANDDADITLYKGKYNSTHVMGFNEADNCSGQSGLYVTDYNGLKLCDTDAAVFYYKNLMKTGMRMVSPNCTEDAAKANGWLKVFYDKATAQDIRIDVIGVHWYDWGGSPSTTPNADANLIFNRFKNYLTTIHNLYGLPIWISEFNANPWRTNAVNLAFMELALPYLETLDYVERYNWFQPNPTPLDPNDNTNNPGTGEFYTTRPPGTNPLLTDIGIFYRDQVSTSAIPEATVDAANSLNLLDYANVALNKPVTASSFYSTYVPDEAVDGNPVNSASAWWANSGVSSLPAWLEVDLQGSFTIDGIRIIEETNALKDFTFEIWDATSSSWTNILPVTGNPATPLTTNKTFPAVTTTKVRLNITAHNSTDYLKILELQVFGVPNSPTWNGITNSYWTVATNWSTGIVPNQDSNVTIAGGTPNQPSISATTTINSLTIDAEATLTVTAPNFTVTGNIANSGTMNLANNSNLIQGGTTNTNTGNITVNRNSNALSRLDYTIWSSPVTNTSQFLTTFSPATSLNRFYNYNEYTNFYNAITFPATTPFALATGYLIRMPNTHPTTPTVWNGSFFGVPNNGTITKAVTYLDATYGYNMIGNPYPSTLDANAFINANLSKIQSTLYFWRKTNGALGSAYATWNLTGSVGTGTASEAGSEIPNGTIQVGQGFFIKAKSAGNVSFTNAMRVADNRNQFFKTKQEQKDRVWLNLTNPAGVFSQTLIGYVSGATVGVDDFDGKYINDSPIALTSNIDNEEYTIQGRGLPFDPSDVVALNFKTDVDGEYTIALDHFDGVFANGQDIYLTDSKTGVETDLKAVAYNFTAAAGVDNARFSLKYQKTLKVDAPAFNENNVRVYKNNGTLYVNSGLVAISNIQVFDVQGRLVSEQKNVKATSAVIKDLKATHQVLIVKITGEDKSVVAKKVIN